MSVGSRRRDENVVRALRATSEQRWQARRNRRALIAKAGLCLVAPALGLMGVAVFTSRCKPPSRVVRPAAPTPPLVTPLSPPSCPAIDGLEDEQRANAIARELRALRASSGRPPATGEDCKSCAWPADGGTQRALNAIIDRYTRCRQAAPSSRGKVVVKALVAPDGRVARTRVAAEPEAAAAASCFAAAVATAQFPRSKGFTVEVPFFTRPELPSGCPETVTARRRRFLDEAIETVSRTCDGPRDLDVCSPRRFPRTFGAQLAIIERDRAIAERRWLAALVNGDPGAIYGLAWLRSRAALPALRQEMTNEFVYPSALFDAAHPTPRQAALRMAIEHISGLPLPRASRLTPAERRALRSSRAQRAARGPLSRR